MKTLIVILVLLFSNYSVAEKVSETDRLSVENVKLKQAISEMRRQIIVLQADLERCAGPKNDEELKNQLQSIYGRLNISPDELKPDGTIERKKKDKK